MSATGHSERKNNSRAIAAHIIARWLESRTFPDRLIDPHAADRPFVMEVVQGVTKWLRMLDWVIGRCGRRPPDDQVRPYLLVGLYQILRMNHVAEHAAVHETVEALKQTGAVSATGYVNGILRRVLRETAAIRAELERQPVGIRESHPDVLVERWSRHFGGERTLALCRWNNERPAVTIHADGRKIGTDELRKRLTSEGIRAVPHAHAPEEYLTLDHGVRVTDLPGYGEGWFHVQDPSTREAVRLLDVRPGLRILDACAAPGGKTIRMAEAMEGRGEIIAMDRHTGRLARLQENLDRMRIDCATVRNGDASSAEELRQRFGLESFDRILADVPCTNTGVLRRRSDARWRFGMESMKELAAMQRFILDALAPLLRPNGRLVYSTCSLEPEENEELIRAWLAGHAGFQATEPIRLFPPETETDGVFAVAIIRGAGSATN